MQQTVADALRRRTTFKRWCSGLCRVLSLRSVAAPVCLTIHGRRNLSSNNRIQRKVALRLTHLQARSAPQSLHRTLLVSTRSKLIAKQLRRRPYAKSLLLVECRILTRKNPQLVQKSKEQTRLMLLETQRRLASSRLVPARL